MDEHSGEFPDLARLRFQGEIWYWRGPSPFHFLSASAAQSKQIKAIAHLVSYGWGMIPVKAQIGRTSFTTAMFYKDGLYILPIKDSVRVSESIGEGDRITAMVEVQLRATSQNR